MRSVIKYLAVVFVVLVGLFIWLIKVQEEPTGIRYAEEAPTATPIPTATEVIAIVFVDDIPTAVLTAPNTPTSTPTFSPTPTENTEMPLEATEKPRERTETPRATESPTPTPKPKKKPTESLPKAYPTGAVGTQYTDDPYGHTWKPYARYWKITKKGTPEYKLREMETTADNGLRIVQDPNGVWRYCIALEPRWAGGQDIDIGRCVDIQMTNGSILHCVLADCKRTENSYNQEGWYGSRGELIEFIADETKLPNWVNGDISKLSKEFEGGIISVTVLDMYIKGFGR